MKEFYAGTKMGRDSLMLVARATAILEEYQLRMTVRQLYYQLVAADLIPNSVKSYKRVVRIMRDARMSGILDWDWIEDRLRRPHVPSTWGSIQEIIRSAKQQFRLDRWKNQEAYIEVWVEKDALAGICGDVAAKWQVTLQVNRGYSSVSAMREAAHRFMAAAEDGRSPVLGYLGDHDPSGEDMVRDVRDRLATFGVEVEVQKLAIMSEDIVTYHLPPQPVKESDSRAGAFMAAHGDECVELDALRPDVLTKRIDDFVLEHLDRDLWDAVQREEDRQRDTVKIEMEKEGD